MWRIRWRRWRAQNPEAGVAALAAVAWVVMAVVHWANHDTAPVSGAPSAGADIAGAEIAVELALWALMTAAMMVPGTLGMVRRLALDSLYARRQRNAFLFIGVYLMAWTLFAALLIAIEQLGSAVWPAVSVSRVTVLVAVLVAAAVWQVSQAKHRWLNACHLRVPLAPRGRAGDLSVFRYARHHAQACIGSCWLVMLAMFVANHDFHLMVPLFVITTYERFVKRPKHRASAALLVLLAAMTALGLT